MVAPPTLPPCPSRTEADLATAAMAFEGARFGKKMLALDQDQELYRARMNAVCDKQAGIGAATLKEPVSGGTAAGSDDVEVFTNSPVSTTNTVNHNYPSSDNKNQLSTICTMAVLFALLTLAIVWQKPLPAPDPVSPPPVVAPPVVAPTPVITPPDAPVEWDVVPTVR